MALTCGKCGLWTDQYETPWGSRIGRCVRKTVDTTQAHECDVPLADLLALRDAADKAIAMREAGDHAVQQVRGPRGCRQRAVR